MRKRLLIILYLLSLLLVLPQNIALAEHANFALDWQFAVTLPQAGVEGTLKGKIEHIRDTEFKFKGRYLNTKSPLSSGAVDISTDLKLAAGRVNLKNLSIKIHKLKLSLPELGLNAPDIHISGSGFIYTSSGTAIFENLVVNAGHLPSIKINLKYSAHDNGSLALKTNDPLPILEKIAGNIFKEFAKWDKSADLKLALNIKNIAQTPEAELQLDINNLSAASPDGSFLVDGISGRINAHTPLDYPKVKIKAACNSGEALLDTFYVDLKTYPFDLAVSSTMPDENGNISSKLQLRWEKICNLTAEGKVAELHGAPKYSGTADIEIPHVKEAFNILAVEPLSLGKIAAGGQLSINAHVNGNGKKTTILGKAGFHNGSFNSDAMTMTGINSRLPFSIALGGNFLPIRDESLTKPKQGFIEIGKIDAAPVSINKLEFPITVSSNKVEFGTLPVIKIKGGTVKLSGLNIKNPFSPNFIFHGILDADDINMLPFSPGSLPINGEISGDLEFWFLADHLSTNGRFFGNVYGGEMTISEIYAENMFESSRQYGADFHVKDLNLEPLSKALDIGRITGRMNLDLTDLVVAYDQPAAFSLHAVTTPGSDTERDISLKAVNTLSVIGTGSGLTGAGVGMFSQFFKEFGYAELGLECTLDDDLFKIRGLIREDGIEYIIKRPPLFGINVVNSNPNNLISFSDMLKRLKRVIKN